VANEEPGGGRWIDVAPERLAGWLESFAQRHGAVSTDPGPETVTFRAADGAIAECHVPFPPLPAGRPETRATEASPAEASLTEASLTEASLTEASPAEASPAEASPAEASTADASTAQAAAAACAHYAGQIAAHACADRTVAVFLVRLGGYAAGIFTGPAPQLAASKVGARLVHGRSAAGGTSQHRFARRREKQAAEALGAAAATAAAVFGPYAGRIDAVVLGGDRRAMATLRTDTRLAPYFGLAVERFLTVPDPRLTVLRGAPRLFRAIRIRLTDPG
jgi:Actinobacteria/chloroflexi VLRF1 release factor